ncbi:MAG: hypothetical protein ACLTLQ_12055 [[Clostridium] scindens]
MNKEIFPECRGVFRDSREAEDCAASSGLKAGIKIAYGGGDTLMQGVGNGIIAPGTLAANIGTACQLSGGFHEPVMTKSSAPIRSAM